MTNSSPDKIAEQKEMDVNRGKEEVNVAFEKKRTEVGKMKEEEEEESEVIWEAVNFALEQLNLDYSNESAGAGLEEEPGTRTRSEKGRPIPKLQSSIGRGSSTKLKSGSNHLNLLQINKKSPMQTNAKLGKQIPKLVPVARSSILRQEESKPGANHLNLIQVCFNLTQIKPP